MNSVTLRWMIGVTCWILAACKGEQDPKNNGDTIGVESTIEITPNAPEPVVNFSPNSITLDYGSREMEIRGKVIHEGGPKPDRVWVWAYFVNPGEGTGGSRSDEPIEVLNPFTDGDTADIVARGHFHWATNEDAPRDGYYAWTNVSAVSEEGARMPVAMRGYGIEGAAKVQVRD